MSVFKRSKVSFKLHYPARSVFECHVTLAEMSALHQQLMSRVKPEEDNVRLYWLTADAVSRTLTIGSEPPEPPPLAHII